MIPVARNKQLLQTKHDFVTCAACHEFAHCNLNAIFVRWQWARLRRTFRHSISMEYDFQTCVQQNKCANKHVLTAVSGCSSKPSKGSVPPAGETILLESIPHVKVGEANFEAFCLLILFNFSLSLAYFLRLATKAFDDPGRF